MTLMRPWTAFTQWAKMCIRDSYTAESLAESLKTITIPDIQAAAERLRLDTVYFLCGEAEA